jgi:hypothetical protein
MTRYLPGTCGFPFSIKILPFRLIIRAVCPERLRHNDLQGYRHLLGWQGSLLDVASDFFVQATFIEGMIMRGLKGQSEPAVLSV